VAEHRSISKTKGVVRILVIFQGRPMLAISFKKSRRELSIDVAEHGSILNKNQYKTPFYFHRQNKYEFPKTGVPFLLGIN